MRLITGLYTGHCPVRYHLKKLGKVDSDTCRMCESEPETTEHIICTCNAFVIKRMTLLGSPHLTPEEVKMKPPKEILDFAKNFEFLEQ